jgi:hypothetical protein
MLLAVLNNFINMLTILFIYFLLGETLNLPYTTKIRLVVVFLIIDIETVFNIELVGMCITYPRTTFHILTPMVR